MSYGLIPVFFVVGALVLIAWGVRVRQATGRLPQDWIRVTGHVVDASLPQRVEYRTPDGRRLRLQGALDESLVVGQAVDVLIDPAEPSRARLVDADRAAAALARTLVLLGVVLLVVGAGAVVAFG